MFHKKIKGATVIGVIGFTLACCVLVAVAVLTAGMASLVSGNGIPNEVSGLVDVNLFSANTVC